AHAAYSPRVIAAEDASRDVALLRRALEPVHPGLYRYTPRAGIDAAFARLEAAAAKPITELALHGEVARMLATIHCDHTKAEMSDALTRYRETEPTHLPLRFQLIEGRMIVVSNDAQVGAPPPGSEILTINGMTVPALLLKLAPLVAYDGSTDQAIAAKLADDGDLMGDDFNENWPALFGFADAWTIDWKPVGALKATTSTLRPATFAAWTGLKGPGARYRSEFYNSVTWRLSGKVARLQVDTFVNYRNPVQATAYLGGVFEAMAAAGTEHLILDLRNNGGGSEDVSVALGRYLMAKPFLWSKPVRYKAVRYGDLPQYFETWGARAARFEPPMALFAQTPEGWFDRIPVARGAETTDEDSTMPQQPVAKGGFRGRLTILSGARNGSGATRTIAQLKEKAGAMIVGEDSAGSAEGPTSGAIFLLRLPASGMKVRIPEAWNRTDIAQFVPGKGVAVDVLVVPTLADFAGGRDRAGEVARGASPAVVDVAELAAKALAGRWTGTLDYRDYGNDSRTTLPAMMASDGRSLDWTYDDGPGKIVRSADRWTFAADGRTLGIGGRGSGGGGEPEMWHVVEARTASDGGVTLVFDGEVLENGRKVIARKILTRNQATLRITKMTRVAGEPFVMRQSHEVRAAPAAD
ncbi:S41 family peptidase, partial [Polymorphobacter multimanifer]|uniref:S41 family peptidase n=1 Tax=Polymorphobacter multimanifer TaxID=1070431 RepID=UPI00166C32A1